MKEHKEKKINKKFSLPMEYLIPDVHHQMLLLFPVLSFPFIVAPSQIKILPPSLCFLFLFSSPEALERWTFPTLPGARDLQQAAILTQALTLAGSEWTEGTLSWGVQTHHGVAGEQLNSRKSTFLCIYFSSAIAMRNKSETRRQLPLLLPCKLNSCQAIV